MKKVQRISFMILMLWGILGSAFSVFAQEPAPEASARAFVTFLPAINSAEEEGKRDILNSAYGPSPVIKGITYEWSTHDRRAPGSDNWPITWGADNHQYTSFGDGGGFGGTDRSGRVSLGLARVEGDGTNYQGINIWGGYKAENPAQFDGKSYGIISIGGVLYKWVSPGSENNNYRETRLAVSTDNGAHWTMADWAFTNDEKIVLPTILQFGKDYAGARDSYVYIYPIRLHKSAELMVQKPGMIDLIRVPKDKLMDRSAYEFFTGVDSSGIPTWTKDLNQRQPVFKDPNGVGWNASVTYNAGLNRYILMTEHDTTMRGRIGIFDAPNPWGPWTTISYGSTFGKDYIDTNTFFWVFSNKWFTNGGKDFVMIFTGVGDNDSWNTVRGSFILR